MTARWAELVGAFVLLTRLPVGGWSAAHKPPADCAWAYPLVGLVVGGCGAAVLAVAEWANVSPAVSVLWALAAMVLLTGGLHEDGLADTADGFGGGRTAERKLLIMRDSRIGSYGALALLLGVGIRAAALAGGTRPAVALVAAAVLGRGAMLLPVLILRPARTDGLAATLRTGRTSAIVGLCLAAPAGFAAPAALPAAAAAALLATWLMRRQVGGYTGDTLGFTEQVVECAVLSAVP